MFVTMQSQAIVSKLQLIRDKLVAPTQSSFVLGWQISNNIIIVQGILHMMRCKQGKTVHMAIKTNLENAYDRIDGPFFCEMPMDIRLP